MGQLRGTSLKLILQARSKGNVVKVVCRLDIGVLGGVMS